MVDDCQSGRPGGYEDSSLAPNDWQRLAQRIFIFRRRGQTLGVNHLHTKQTTQIYKVNINISLLLCEHLQYFPHCVTCTEVLWQSTQEQTRAGNTNKKSKTTRNTFGLKSSLSLVPAMIHFLSGETRSMLTLKESHTITLDFSVNVESASVHTDP